MNACHITIQDRVIHLQPGMAVTVNASSSTDPIYLVTSIFRCKDKQGIKHHMIQVCTPGTPLSVPWENVCRNQLQALSLSLGFSVEH